ncbi:MAG: hypothetical protein HY865_08815 [Chloroflexi bacterium]|nr:hypothetical protein [Chloroflexota bacterium]
MLKRIINSPRLEIFIAVMIALASATTALVTWRTSSVNSEAGNAIRQGLIDAVKKQASANESWRRVYEQARYAQTYTVTLAQVEAYEADSNKAGKAQAENMRQYLLPSLLLLAEPLGTDEKYQKKDGAYDLELYFADIQSEAPDLAALDPEASFELSDSYGAEQRWLTVGIVILAVSLFWLALAELNSGNSRAITLTIGLGVYFFSLAWFGVVEIIFISTRGGVL